MEIAVARRKRQRTAVKRLWEPRVVERVLEVRLWAVLVVMGRVGRREVIR